MRRHPRWCRSPAARRCGSVGGGFLRNGWGSSSLEHWPSAVAARDPSPDWEGSPRADAAAFERGRIFECVPPDVRAWWGRSPRQVRSRCSLSRATPCRDLAAGCRAPGEEGCSTFSVPRTVLNGYGARPGQSGCVGGGVGGGEDRASSCLELARFLCVGQRRPAWHRGGAAGCLGTKGSQASLPLAHMAQWVAGAG